MVPDFSFAKFAFKAMAVTIIVLVILLLASLVGCESSQEVDRRAIGKIESVEVFPGSYKHPPQALVRCEQATVLLVYTAPVSIGQVAYIIEKSDGTMWLTWDGTSWRYRICK